MFYICVCVFVEQLIFWNKMNSNSAQVTDKEKKVQTLEIYKFFIIYHTYSVYITCMYVY